uniref:Rho GTPase activating protein 26 n=1 Tax=Eptatretus burgeri TaxID=7764 RepID=A0A8C4QGT6_EPTBU
MGLPALEFTECGLDSPQFRERLKSHEVELDRTSKAIKNIIKDGKALLAAFKNVSQATRRFCQSLDTFKFECIGDTSTDNEAGIAGSLKEFAKLLGNVEDERERMIANVSDVLITPLEKFRKEQIGAAKEQRKRFEKQSDKYYCMLDKHLGLSAKKKEAHLLEADSQLNTERQMYIEASLQYVVKVQEVHECKKFEFVEPLVAFLQGLFTFYHQGYEMAKEFGPYKRIMQSNIQQTRSSFESTRQEVELLLQKLKASLRDHVCLDQHGKQGYLCVQEKRHFGTASVKHYCMFDKATRLFRMVPYDPKPGGRLNGLVPTTPGETDCFRLKSCIRRKTDSIEKRFCFDVEGVDRAGVMTFQAPSEDERRLWMEVMDGKEPVYTLPQLSSSCEQTELNDLGFSFITKCIEAVEARGLATQGLYRIVGVSSKVQRLLTVAIDEKTSSDVDLNDAQEWDVKTITSALKTYLRNLPEPLMTYNLYRSFIQAAKLEHQETRGKAVHALVYQLPDSHREMLNLIIQHLITVSNQSKSNLMTVANLGVVFGPTLMRAEEETVAAILDLKFHNIVVEIMIENYEKIFHLPPDPDAPLLLPQPNVPHRPGRQQGSFNLKLRRPLAIYNPVSPANDQGSEQIQAEVNEKVDAAAQGGMSDSSDSISSRSSNATPVPATPPGASTISDLTIPALCEDSTFPASGEITDLTSDTTQTCSPISGVAQGKQAHARYACEAEHDTELSFMPGDLFTNVLPSREPGWLEATLGTRRGLIPENYVDLL